MSMTDLCNFAANNKILITSNFICELEFTLKSGVEQAIGWFREKDLIVNPDKFQAMILESSESSTQPETLEIGTAIIKTTDSRQLI